MPLRDEASEVAREAAHRFGALIRDEVDPGAASRDAAGTPLPRALMRRCGELGLLGYSLPTALGGEGADACRWGLMLEALGQLCEDGSLPLVVSLHAAVANALHRSASPALVERFVAPLVTGERVGCFAYTEGSDPFSFRSAAIERGDRYVLTADKVMVTGGSIGDTFMTYVRRGSGDLGVFIVDREDPGVTIEPVDVSGLRAAGLARLRLDAVELPADRLLIANDGLSHVQRFLNERRVLLVCGPLGRMRAIVESIATRLGKTIRYGRPLSTLPNVEATLGRMCIAVETARAITHRALAGMRRADRNPMFDPDAAIAKHYVVEQAIALGLDALRLAGGDGYVRGYHYERYLRDFHGGLAGGGAQDVLEVDLGAHLSSMIDRRGRREGER